jgi:hypothetical protein
MESLNSEALPSFKCFNEILVMHSVAESDCTPSSSVTLLCEQLLTGWEKDEEGRSKSSTIKLHII